MSKRILGHQRVYGQILGHQRVYGQKGAAAFSKAFEKRRAAYMDGIWLRPDKIECWEVLREILNTGKQIPKFLICTYQKHYDFRDPESKQFFHVLSCSNFEVIGEHAKRYKREPDPYHKLRIDFELLPRPLKIKASLRIQEILGIHPVQKLEKLLEIQNLRK